MVCLSAGCSFPCLPCLFCACVHWAHVSVGLPFSSNLDDICPFFLAHYFSKYPFYVPYAASGSKTMCQLHVLPWLIFSLFFWTVSSTMSFGSLIFSYTISNLSLLLLLSQLQSCPTLCDPIDSSPPDIPVPGILQARTLEWLAIAFSKAWKWKWSRPVMSDS